MICALGVLAASAVAALAFERLPHLEDEVAYLFQAKTLALGRLTIPSPPLAGAFWYPFVLDHNGERFGKYPPGWPALLALGVLARVPWLVNPLLVGLALYLVYRLGQTLYDERTGLLAAVLGLASPLTLVLGGSMLSHMASLVWLLLFSLWFVWTAQGRSHWYAVGSGLALGFAFLTRSLTAVGFAIPLAAYAAAQIVRRRAGASRFFAIAAAALPVIALLPAYQWAVTGDPWLNPYLLWWPYDRIGFGPGVGWMPGGHSPAYGWLNLRQDLASAATDLLGWPMLSWAPLVLGLALRPRRAQDGALLAPFACLAGVYFFYWIGSPERLWGPRYYYEGFGGLWILAAAGLWKTWAWVRDRGRLPRAAAAAAAAALFCANLALVLPPRIQAAHGFYGISAEQFRPIEQAGLHRALVIVEADRWLEYGALLSQMSPTLQDDVVYARHVDAQTDAALIAHFRDRSAYYLRQGSLRPAETAR